MGVLFSRLRKKKETTEVLEELEGEIKNCINFRLENQESQRRWVGRLTLWGITSYIILALLYYLIYFPEGWVQRIVYSAVLIIVPVILILASRKSLMWYYSRKITNNEEKLLLLKEEKEKILEEVMENETYKKAKEILEKFDPERHKTMTPPRLGTKSSQPTPGSEIRQRKGGNVLPKPIAPPPPSSAAHAIGPPPPPPLPKAPISSANGTACPNGVTLRPPINTPVRTGAPVGGTPIGGTPMRPARMLPPGSSGANFSIRGPTQMMGRPPILPRPVLQADRGVLDRLAEYLVGDGPTNRYALICRRCHRHNGMALKEEFEYLAFHCAYCQFLNPAKRKRPSAPRLPESNPPSRCDSDAGSESDNAGSPKPKSFVPKTSDASVNGGSHSTENPGGSGVIASSTVAARTLAIEPTVNEDGEEDSKEVYPNSETQGEDDRGNVTEAESRAVGEEEGDGREDGSGNVAEGNGEAIGQEVSGEVVRDEMAEEVVLGDDDGAVGGASGVSRPSPSLQSSSEKDDVTETGGIELSGTNEAMEVDPSS